MSFDDYTKQGGRVPRQDVKTMEVPQPPLEGDHILTSKDGIVAWLPTPQSVEAGVLVGSRGKIGWKPRRGAGNRREQNRRSDDRFFRRYLDPTPCSD